MNLLYFVYTIREALFWKETNVIAWRMHVQSIILMHMLHDILSVFNTRVILPLKVEEAESEMVGKWRVFW